MPYAFYAENSGNSVWAIGENSAISYSEGEVGISTNSPLEQFQIGDRWTFHNGTTKFIGYNTYWGNGELKRIFEGGASNIRFENDGDIHLVTIENGNIESEIDFPPGVTVKNNRRVGIGTFSPLEQFQIGDRWTFHNGTTKFIGYNTHYEGEVLKRITNGSASTIRFENDGDIHIMAINNGNAGSEIDFPAGITLKHNGNVGVGTYNPTKKLDVNGTTRTKILEITGGGDLAEGFDINTESDKIAPRPGYLVSIDPANPGQLKICTEAYDKKLAGVISGANGINPGMLMGQEGTLVNGEYPVALTGRVYVWADASSGAIEPGDMLTSSAIPGYAMKVIEFEKARGAVIGKAMTCLDEGQGYILVLVK